MYFRLSDEILTDGFRKKGFWNPPLDDGLFCLADIEVSALVEEFSQW